MIAREEINYINVESNIGNLNIAKSKIGVCAIFINSNTEYFFNNFRNAHIKQCNKSLENLAIQIKSMIENPNLISSSSNIELDIRGTNFQKQVWKKLQAIPLGETVSYKELASSLNMPTAYRAVARACATNLLAVIIPCHRVIKSNGDISGYRWGVDVKHKLLCAESKAANLSSL